MKVLINEAESGRNPTSAAIVDRLEIDLRQWLKEEVKLEKKHKMKLEEKYEANKVVESRKPIKKNLKRF